MLNYIGPNEGEGIRGYMNGVEVANDKHKDGGSRSAGDGRIVVGRGPTDSNSHYTSVQVDEMMYFNAALTTDHIQSIYNSA